MPSLVEEGDERSGDVSEVAVVCAAGILETEDVLEVRKDLGGGGGGAAWVRCFGATGGGGELLLGELSGNCSELFIANASDCEDPFGKFGLKVECKGKSFEGPKLWNGPAWGTGAGLWTRLESQKSRIK